MSISPGGRAPKIDIFDYNALKRESRSTLGLNAAKITDLYHKMLQIKLAQH